MENGLWKIRRNNELQLCKDCGILSEIKMTRVRWVGSIKG